MKLLLVFLNNEYRPMIPVNLTSLESYVRHHGGHEVRVFDTSFYAEMSNVDNFKRNIQVGSYFDVDYSEYGISIKESSMTEDLLNMIADYSPDLVGFSVYSYTEGKADEMAQAVKNKFREIPIIYGGIHVSLQPEINIKKKWVDLVCCGEGEAALLDVCNAIDSKSKTDNIKNIWVMNGGEIIKNQLRPLIDPNTIPKIDWRSYASYQHYGPIEGKIYKLAMVEFGRGCPNSCSYCEGVLIKKMYAENGIKKYGRHKDPEKFVDDCEFLVKEYGIEFFYFTDGTFLTMTEKVLEKLARLFKEKVNRPFLCLTTAPSITENKARLMGEMGCYQVNMGIEAGNQEYRKRVLNRPNMSDKVIVNAFKLMKANGVRTSAYNMMGLPWQNRADFFETIELNRKCKPHRTNIAIYIPFPHTPLTQQLRDEGFIDDNTLLGDETSATVRVPSDMSLDEIKGLHRTFNLYCKVPKKLFPLLEACEGDNENSKFVIDKLREIYLPKQ